MAAASVHTVTVVYGSTLVSVLCPASQTLTGVSTWACLYTFGLQGRYRAQSQAQTAMEEAENQKPELTYVHTAAASERWSAGVRLHTGDTVPLETRFTDTPDVWKNISCN